MPVTSQEMAGSILHSVHVPVRVYNKCTVILSLKKRKNIREREQDLSRKIQSQVMTWLPGLMNMNILNIQGVMLEWKCMKYS